jgi:uncharacterized protein (TIGR02687 family)
MYEKMHAAIRSHFTRHRLIFWYDPEGKHREVVEALDETATVLEASRNEWWIKYHVLRERPEEKFLIYAPYQRPADRDNWLLDLVLAGFSFSHDLSETYRTELGLGENFRPFCADHVGFFQNVRERWEPLKELVTPDSETVSSLAVKMMGILTAADAEERRTARDFPRILFALVEEAVTKAGDGWDAVCKFGLEAAFRDELRAYLPEVPDAIEPAGAVLEVFRQVWKHELAARPKASSNANTNPEQRNCRVLLHEWRHQYAAGERYRQIVEYAQKTLGVETDVDSLSTDTLAELHLFPAVDSELAHRLVAEAIQDTADLQRIRRIAGERKNSWWVRESGSPVESIYSLLVSYVDLERTVHKISLKETSTESLVSRYMESLHTVDRLYRSCLLSYRTAGSPGGVAHIMDRIEGRYLHQFLQPLAETWDRARRGGPVSYPDAVVPQRRFFDCVVTPYLQKGDKLVVIISDALRFEAGCELEERLGAVNRLSLGVRDIRGIRAMIAAVPTVTAVGMAALLPHKTLSLNSDNTVRIDGKNVAGIEGRSAFLAEYVGKRFIGKRAAAFRARDIAALPATAAREQINGLDLIYLYSDGIDAVADNAKTERNLPEAVEAELDFLTAVVRKFATQLNRTHIVITADHGFLYQDSAPEEIHMIAAEKPTGGVRERRYLVGGIAPEDHFNTVPDEAVDVESDALIYFADGLFRIRKQGGGNRYVHGGLSLQELLVPLIQVRVGRRDDVKDVGVAVMKAAQAVITTPSYVVNFFQEEPTADKTRPVTVRAYFSAEDGTVLSDTVEITFDSSSPDARNRSRSVEFHFSPIAVKYNGSMILLKLQKVVGGSMVPYGTETFRYQTIGERDF